MADLQPSASIQRVAIVEYQRLFGEALTQLIASDVRFTVVSCTPTLDAEVSIDGSPDMVILDLDMQRRDLPALVGIVRREAPAAHLCVLSSRVSPELAERAIALGADGFIVKDVLPGEFLQALRSIADGASHVDGRVASALLQRRNGSRASSTLSARETEVLRLIAQGSANKEIAAKLGLSVKTIKNQLSKIFTKLGIDSRTKAAVRAIDMGLI